MEEGFINHLYYKIIGEGEPIVMIAGLGADHLSWIPLANHLKNRFKIILFDNRGIGKSSTPDDGKCTIDKMADDVLLIFRQLKIDKAYVLGHSMGSYIAQVFASKFPQKVKKLILLSSKLQSQAVQKLYTENTLKMMELSIPRDLIIKNSLCWLFSNTYLSDPQNINKSVEISMKKPLEESRKSYFYQIHATLDFNTYESARKITNPTLIITGNQDILVTLQDAKELHENIPNSLLEILENMGHMAHIEIPDIVAGKVIKFIDKRENCNNDDMGLKN